MLTPKKTDDVHVLTVLGKLLNPAVKKTQYGVVFIDDLGADE